MEILRFAVLAVLACSPLSVASPAVDGQNQTIVRRSAVPFGAYIDRCSVPGTIALTFDDGPHVFTPKILDILSSRGARATFFVNGQNFGNIFANAGMVQRAIADGHQLGSHTYDETFIICHRLGDTEYILTKHRWGHPYLTTLDYNGVVAQMTELENAFIQIMGRFPTYMRPPYLAVNGVVLSAMAQLGYHVIGASIDTKDYENDNPAAIQNSLAKFRNELNAGGTISLAHDVHQNTVDILVQAMIDEVSARGLRGMYFRMSFLIYCSSMYSCSLVMLTSGDSGSCGRMSRRPCRSLVPGSPLSGSPALHVLIRNISIHGGILLDTGSCWFLRMFFLPSVLSFASWFGLEDGSGHGGQFLLSFTVFHSNFLSFYRV